MTRAVATVNNSIVRTRRTKWKTRFISALEKTGVVGLAARAAGVSRQTVYTHIKKDEDFAAEFDRAVEDSADRLEAEAVRRAVEGVEEPVFGKLEGANAGTGEVGTIRRYSDTLLIFMLKGRKPDVFRERVDHTVKGVLLRWDLPLPPGALPPSISQS